MVIQPLPVGVGFGHLGLDLLVTDDRHPAESHLSCTEVGAAVPRLDTDEDGTVGDPFPCSSITRDGQLHLVQPGVIVLRRVGTGRVEDQREADIEAFVGQHGHHVELRKVLPPIDNRGRQVGGIIDDGLDSLLAILLVELVGVHHELGI